MEKREMKTKRICETCENRCGVLGSEKIRCILKRKNRKKCEVYRRDCDLICTECEGAEFCR